MIWIAREGVEPVAMQALVNECGYSCHEVDWVIGARTLKRRLKKKELLSINETDRLLRAANLQALAKEVFGNPDKALAWLRRPRKPFYDLSAMELMQTEIGARLVEDLLSQLDAGYNA